MDEENFIWLKHLKKWYLNDNLYYLYGIYIIPRLLFLKKSKSNLLPSLEGRN
jgi:hypothetical protein